MNPELVKFHLPTTDQFSVAVDTTNALLAMPVIFQHISIGRGSYLSMELEASRYQSLIVLIRSRGPSGEPVMRLGMPMVDDNLDFLKGSLPAENGQRPDRAR